VKQYGHHPHKWQIDQKKYVYSQLEESSREDLEALELRGFQFKTVAELIKDAVSQLHRYEKNYPQGDRKIKLYRVWSFGCARVFVDQIDSEKRLTRDEVS